MKNSAYSAFIFAASTLFCTLGHPSGWSSGGGGGFRDMADNIWFIGSEPVNYCIHSSPNFPLSKEKLTTLTRTTIQEWTQFLESEKLAGPSLSGIKYGKRWVLAEKEHRSKSINLNFQESACSPSTDLQFFFGISNPDIELHRNLNDEHKIGLALRKEFDHVRLRNPGYVWISDFSRSEVRIKHLLLHEIGHVLGFRHDTLPIMDASVASQLIESRIPDSFFAKLELPSWPYKLKAGQSHLLTANYGVKWSELVKNRENGANRSTPECGSEAYPNALVPLKVAKQLGLTLPGCHQVRLKMLDPDFTQRKFKLELKIEDTKSNRNFTLVGTFTHTRVANSQHPSPHVFTRAIAESDLSRQNPALDWVQLRLDDSVDLYPARGSFEWNGKSHAARLSYDKGPILELFLDNRMEGTWWVIRNFSALLDKVE